MLFISQKIDTLDGMEKLNISRRRENKQNNKVYFNPFVFKMY